MSKLSKALIAAAGNAGGDNLYVEDVFSTYLYTGTGADQTITNGIDLDGEGGLVWVKGRDTTYDHRLFDTERGVGEMLSSNNSGAEQTLTEQLEAFNSDGFQVGTNLGINGSTKTYASWTFRKAEKFFDVVTYTGDGASSRYINHNLGANAGAIFIKRTDSASDWTVQHRYNNNYNLYLNSTAAQSDSGATNRFNDTYFTVIGSGLADSNKLTNINGATYVAYLFASDAGGFGDDGDKSIIKCGSYTGNGNADGPEVDLGFEPQWVLIKGVTSGSSYNWAMFDTMRGMPVGAQNQRLYANSADAETTTTANGIDPTPTGFKVTTQYGYINGSGGEYIYIAIRRPMKTPESGTEVFAIDNGNGTSGYDSGFPVDMGWRFSDIAAGSGFQIASRLNAKKNLYAYSSNAENNAGGFTFDSNIGWGTSVGINTNDYSWMFKRATGFFDVVAYTGDGSFADVNHNLGVLPEMIIVKRRDGAMDWYVWHEGQGAVNSNQRLNRTNAVDLDFFFFNSTANTATTFRAGNTIHSNLDDYVAYLFATVTGVSKVGSYTGTGSNVDVDCGFSAGARFILIKRADSTGDWYVWDSERGIVAGNDPYLLLNSTAAEVTSTDYIDPLSSGFTVTSSAPAALNASGGTYIFLAIS